VLSAVDGKWLVPAPLAPMMKPGGHGAIWKLMLDEGIFDWFEKQGRVAAIIRQIRCFGGAISLVLFPYFWICKLIFGRKEAAVAWLPLAIRLFRMLLPVRKHLLPCPVLSLFFCLRWLFSATFSVSTATQCPLDSLDGLETSVSSGRIIPIFYPIRPRCPPQDLSARALITAAIYCL
jgi:hypothetical protein